MTPNDQAKQQTKPPSTKRRKHTKPALDTLPYYATHTHAPTLSDLHQAASGAFAQLLVAYFAEQGQGGAA